LAGERPSFDLQSHSTHSDGELLPAELVSAAATAGVELLALTDHDSVDGVPEAREAAARSGIGLVTGVEISALDGGDQDLHVLGYLIDETDAAMRARLSASRCERESRAQRMVDALLELGFAIDESLLRTRRERGQAIGRPHIAQAVVNHPGNARRLRNERLTEPSAFLVAYLIEGRPAFRPRLAPSVADAIELIHGAGGAAVWAHPFFDIATPRSVLSTLDRFAALGLDGVEVFYITHTREQTELLAGRCAELGLLSTGSSDFHGPHHREFNRFRAFETHGLRPNLGPLRRPPPATPGAARLSA
jgi:predicted metal-dependent phosphoesterase TrpH